MSKLRIAWDTTTIIDALERTPKWWPHVKPMYDDATHGKIEIIVSEISVAEACRLDSMTKGNLSIAAGVKLIRDFFDNTFFLRRPADRRESALAAEFIRIWKLETCDAIIVATAAIHGAATLYTRDGLKKRKKSKSCPLKCDGKLSSNGIAPFLEIKAPDYYGSSGTLFAKPPTP